VAGSLRTKEHRPAGSATLRKAWARFGHESGETRGTAQNRVFKKPSVGPETREPDTGSETGAVNDFAGKNPGVLPVAEAPPTYV
jgi:hypothetical protein